MTFFHFDPATGALHPEQTLSTLPPDFKGTSFTSEIVLSAGGRFLYAANRLHDSVAVFSLGPDGRLQYKGETSTMGDYPRYIQIAPGGKFLYACNQRSDSLASFRIDRETGMLGFTGKYTGSVAPHAFYFLPEGERWFLHSAVLLLVVRLNLPAQGKPYPLDDGCPMFAPAQPGQYVG